MLLLYQKYMRGVDRVDQRLRYFRPRGKSHLWWTTLAMHIINITVHNAFILHRNHASDNCMSNRTFRLKLALALIDQYCGRKPIGRPGISIVTRIHAKGKAINNATNVARGPVVYAREGLPSTDVNSATFPFVQFHVSRFITNGCFSNTVQWNGRCKMWLCFFSKIQVQARNAGVGQSRDGPTNKRWLAVLKS